MSGTKDEALSHHHEKGSDAKSEALGTAPTGTDGTTRSTPVDTKRKCVITQDNENLLHCVFDPSGNLVFDLKDKLTVDNSFYIKLDRTAIKSAYDQGFFKTENNFNTLLDSLISRLKTDFYQMVALLRRTGDLVFGAVKVESLMRHSEVATALVSEDLKALPSYFNSLKEGRVIQFGYAEEYGPLFSRERVVFIGLKRHHLTPILLDRIKIIKNLQNS